MSRAYLVAQFDVSGPAPKLAKMGIFSEPEPTIVAPLATWQVVVATMSAEDFETAYWRLVDHVARVPYYTWTRPYVRKIVERDMELRKILQRHGVLTLSKGDLVCARCSGGLERIAGRRAPSTYRCTACGTVWRMPVAKRKKR